MKIELDWKILLFGVILVVVLVLLVARSCRNEEDRILSRFDELCDLNSLEQTETALKAGLKAKEICDYFVPDLTISAQSAPISVGSLRELRQIIFKARTTLNRIDVDARKSRVLVAQDEKSAAMTVGLRIVARGQGMRETFNEAFNIDWVLENNEWKIARVKRYETIRTIE